MHYAVILLIQTDSRDDARTEAESFMDQQRQAGVCDYYNIGGRWSGTLAPMWPRYCQTVRRYLKRKKWSDDNTNKILLEWKKKTWKRLNGRGNPPDTVPYDTETSRYDVVRLIGALPTVRKWAPRIPRDAKNMMKQARQYKKEQMARRRDDSWMAYYGYLVIKAGELYAERFCNEAHVFNVTDYSYLIPEDPSGWWAVMIDYHN